MPAPHTATPREPVTAADIVRARQAELAARFPDDLRPALARCLRADGDTLMADIVDRCITDHPDDKVTGEYGVGCGMCTNWATDRLRGDHHWLPEVYQ